MLALLFACAKAPPPPPPVPPPAGDVELVESGPPSARVSTKPADLVLFYAGEHKGSLESCGCPNRPRGSLTRMLSYIDASRAANPGVPDLVLNGGYWLDDTGDFSGGLRADVPVLNRWLVAGFDLVGFDAANVTPHELPGLDALAEIPPWAVSANVVGSGDKALATGIILTKGGLRVGVTGITAMGATSGQNGSFTVEDPYAPGLAALNALAPQVDVLVLLAYRAPEVARALAEAVPALDVVIDTNEHRSLYEPLMVGNAIWVRSHYETLRLGELRLNVEDQAAKLVIDRKIDLDPELPDAPGLAALLTDARAEIEAAQKAAFEAP